jgi:hypothetical protein
VAGPTPSSVAISLIGFVGCGTSARPRVLTSITSAESFALTRIRLGARQTPRCIFHSVTRTISSCVTCGCARDLISAGNSVRYQMSSGSS